MLEQSKSTAVLRSVQTYAENYLKLHGFPDPSNVGLCVALYFVEYTILNLFHNIYLLQNQELHQRGKCSKSGIDSCSYAGEVAIKHTRIIGKIPNQIMPLLGRQHSGVILVPY